MTVLFKILCSLLIGCLVGGTVYLIAGVLHRSNSGDSEGKGGTGGSSTKKKTKKERPKDDNENSGGTASGSGLTPTKEWVGGSRG